MGAADNYEPGTFARFFRAVKGRHVTRFGTHRATMTRKGPVNWQAPETFGGTRPPMTAEQLRAATKTPAVGSRSLTARPCNPIELDTEKVTAITHEEARRFGRVYDKYARQESLVEVDEAAYIAWLRESDKRAEEATRKEAERQKAAAKEKKLAADLAKARAEKTTPTVAASGRTDEPEVPAP